MRKIDGGVAWGDDGREGIDAGKKIEVKGVREVVVLPKALVRKKLAARLSRRTREA
jgi:hypothetical protein